MTINPVRLNHAVLFVSDLAQAERFYLDVFGMLVITREPRANAVFLRLPRSGNHHDLGLFGVGPRAPKRRGGIGLYDLAWQVDTIDELEHARPALRAADAHTGESSHGATKSICGADPDGNEFEIVWRLPRDEWGEYENAAPIDRLDLAAELRRWSGIARLGASCPARSTHRRTPCRGSGTETRPRPPGATRWSRASAPPPLAKVADWLRHRLAPILANGLHIRDSLELRDREAEVG